MRYIMTLIWSVLISLVVTYVVTSMAGAAFNSTSVFVLAAVIFLAIFVLGELILKEKEEY